jgi:hypothetical protein
MMRLLFVADGDRDEHTVPELVGGILKRRICLEFRAWKSIRVGGYDRKLEFALRIARDSEVEGLVATIDCDNDKPGRRLSKLRDGRGRDRLNPKFTPLPTALGEAVPHLEAWLLDDEKAVREVLRFPGEKRIPNVVGTDPKACLNELVDESERPERTVELLPELARSIDIGRCNHSAVTGFDQFVNDVEAELGPLSQK